MNHADQLRRLAADDHTSNAQVLLDAAARLDELLEETDRLTLRLHDATEHLAIFLDGAASCIPLVAGLTAKDRSRVDLVL